MGFEDLALELIDRIYAAAENPQLWDSFLERLAVVVGATVTGFIFEDLESHRSRVHSTLGVPPDLVRQYEEYYASHNAWIAAAGFRLPEGEVLTGTDLLSDADLQKSEYYNDFLRRIDAHHVLTATLLGEKKRLSMVSLLRPKRAGPFGDRSIELLRLLVPHLKRALQLHRRMAGLKSEREAAVEVLDRVPAGVILLDRKGRPVLVNRAGRDILESSDGLSLTRDGLAAAASEEATVLRRLVHDAIEIATGRSVLCDSSGTLAVSRPSLRRPYLVFVTPLRSKPPEADLRPAAAVFVTDPERRVPANGPLFKSVYRFTPAEAAVALRLIQGESIEQAAENLEITVNTARTHLKRLFAKTDTNRHRELVRVLLLACANLPPAA